MDEPFVGLDPVNVLDPAVTERVLERVRRMALSGAPDLRCETSISHFLDRVGLLHRPMQGRGPPRTAIRLVLCSKVGRDDGGWDRRRRGLAGYRST